MPGQDLRHPRGARRHRRHLGPVPLPGHPLGLRHVHARATRSGRGRRRRRSPTARRSSATSARRRATTASTARSASTIASWAPSGRRADARWTVEVERTDTGETVQLDLRLPVHVHRLLPLRRGLTRPSSRASSASRGQIVHPQHWPEDLDYDGKRVVVIGSGATAVTLVPAMAEQAAHVTMLQRSPSYVVSLPGAGPDRRPRCAASCRRRSRIRSCAGRTCCSPRSFFQLSRRAPALHQGADPQGRRAKRLPPGYDVDHALQAALQPVGPARLPGARRRPLRGDPQRAAPRSSPTGSRRSPRTGSGSRPARELEADMIVTATGLNLLPLGGMAIDRGRQRRSSSPRRSATRA